MSHKTENDSNNFLKEKTGILLYADRSIQKC